MRAPNAIPIASATPRFGDEFQWGEGSHWHGDRERERPHFAELVTDPRRTYVQPRKEGNRAWHH